MEYKDFIAQVTDDLTTLHEMSDEQLIEYTRVTHISLDSRALITELVNRWEKLRDEQSATQGED